MEVLSVTFEIHFTHWTISLGLSSQSALGEVFSVSYSWFWLTNLPIGLIWIPITSCLQANKRNAHIGVYWDIFLFTFLTVASAFVYLPVNSGDQPFLLVKLVLVSVPCSKHFSVCTYEEVMTFAYTAPTLSIQKQFGALYGVSTSIVLLCYTDKLSKSKCIWQ